MSRDAAASPRNADSARGAAVRRKAENPRPLAHKPSSARTTPSARSGAGSPLALSFLAQSILGQILHYRVFKPMLERMAIGDLSDRTQIRRIADHIARFSLGGLGCSLSVIDRAVAEAGPPANSKSRTGRTDRDG